MDSATTEFFEELRASDAANSLCADCGAANPQWASVSHGTFVCLVCSGQHRSLGVHLSFVRSVQMDVWNDKQKAKMRLGGNSRFRQVLLDFDLLDATSNSLAQEVTASRIPGAQKEKFFKYNTKALQWYRDLLAAQVDSMPLPQSPPLSEAKLPVHSSAPSLAHSRNSTPPVAISSATAAGNAAGSFAATVTSLGSRLSQAAETDHGWADLLDSALTRGKALASSAATATQKAASELLDQARADGGVAAAVKARADGVASWVKDAVASPAAPTVPSTAAEDPTWAELR